MRFLVYCESHGSCEVPRVLWKPRFLWGSSCTVKATILVRFLVYCESHGSCEVPRALWKPWFLWGSSCSVKATVLARFSVYCESHGSCTVKAMVLARFLMFCESHGSCEVHRVLWKPQFLYIRSNLQHPLMRSDRWWSLANNFRTCELYIWYVISNLLSSWIYTWNSAHLTITNSQSINYMPNHCWVGTIIKLN